MSPGVYAFTIGGETSDWFFVRVDDSTPLADGRYHVRGFWLNRTAVGWSTGEALADWATFNPASWARVEVGL